jgi:hypothetical protein
MRVGVKTLFELSDEELRMVALGEHPEATPLAVKNARKMIEERRNSGDLYYAGTNLVRVVNFVRLLIKHGEPWQQENIQRLFKQEEMQCILCFLQAKDLETVSRQAKKAGIFGEDAKNQVKALLDQFLLFVWQNYHEDIVEFELGKAHVIVPAPPKETGDAQTLLQERRYKTVLLEAPRVNRSKQHRDADAPVSTEVRPRETTHIRVPRPPRLRQEEVDLSTLSQREKYVLGRMYLFSFDRPPNVGELRLRPLKLRGISKFEVMAICSKLGFPNATRFPRKVYENPLLAEFAVLPEWEEVSNDNTGG